jgi:hypothetical protein
MPMIPSITDVVRRPSTTIRVLYNVNSVVLFPLSITKTSTKPLVE